MSLEEIFGHSEERKLEKIIRLLEELLERQPRFLPEKLVIKWSVNDMATNPVSLNLDPTAKAVGVVTELNSDGSVFKFDPTKIAVQVQDSTVVSASVDPTTGNVTVTPLKIGSSQVAVQDTATEVASPVYTFTVVQSAVTPSSLSVSWTVTP